MTWILYRNIVEQNVKTVYLIYSLCHLSLDQYEKIKNKGYTSMLEQADCIHKMHWISPANT